MPWLSVLKWGALRRQRWIWRPPSQEWKCSSIFLIGSPSGWAAESTLRRRSASGLRRNAVSTGCPGHISAVQQVHPSVSAHPPAPWNSAVWVLPCLCHLLAFDCRPVILILEVWLFTFLIVKCLVLALSLMTLGYQEMMLACCGGSVFISPTSRKLESYQH